MDRLSITDQMSQADQDKVLINPYRRAKGKFHYPIAGLFSASLKMKIKIFFLLEIVRNDV